jgi:parvulin-like peptidyl-prolyl isomerase
MLFWPHAKQPDVTAAASLRMRYLTTTFLVAALAAVLAGCGGGGGSVPSNAVAKVGKTTITQAQFNDLLEQAKRSYQSQKRKFPAAGTTEYQTLKNQAVQYLVQRIEFAQEADTLGIKVTDKDIAARLAQIKKQYFGGKESRYKKQLKQQGLTDEQVKDDIKAQLISEKIFKKVTGNVQVTDAQVKKYYDQHQSQYGTPEQREVAHILVKSKALADKLYDRVKAGEDFSKLAKKYSQDPGSKSQGGKLTISKGQTVGPFDQTAFLLSTGQVSRPVKTDFGYHIIKALGDVKPAKTTAFAQVKSSIRQQLLQQKKNEAMTNWQNKLKKDFDGKISYQTGYAPPTTSQATTTSS